MMDEVGEGDAAIVSDFASGAEGDGGSTLGGAVAIAGVPRGEGDAAVPRGLISARARPALLPLLLLPLLSLPVNPSDPYLGAIILAWTAYLIGRLFVSRGDRLVSAVWLALTLYSVSAWVAYSFFNKNYFPFPSQGVIERATILSLQCAIGSYALLRLFVDCSEWDRQIRSSARRLGERLRDAPTRPIALSSALLFVLGAIDVLRLGQIGVSEVLVSDRRAFAAELLSTGNHNVQLVAMVASVVVGCYMLVGESRGLRAIGFVAFSIFWIPFLLVGSRKEFLIVAIGVFFGCVGTVPKIRKRLMWMLAAVTAIALFLLPVIRGKDIVYSFHEFILPQYMLFTVTATDPPGGLGQDFLDRSFLLVPASVRPKEVQDLGTSFADLGFTTTGVGSNPIAEAKLWGALPPIVTFTFLTLLLFLMIGRFSRTNPGVAVLGLPHLLLWGRSEFWVTVFFLLYGVIGLRLLVGRFGRRAAPEPEAAVPLQEPEPLSISW